MYGNKQDDERLDPAGFEVPFVERFGEASSPYALSELRLGEETFVTPPADEGMLAASEGLSWLESAVQTAESQAAEASEAEWLETEWLETPSSADTESLESFAERLGREWSRRRNGDPTAEAIRSWLLQDHEDTVAGAKLRWGGHKVAADFWSRISRAWMTAREEQMRFQTEHPSGVGALGQFAPPSEQVELMSDPLIGGSDKAPVAPLTARFARELRRRFGPVSMSNYRGHGGGAFYNRGYSLDLFLSGRDTRGFYRKEDAIRLLRAIHTAAGAVQAQWRAIYNDFSVADAINRALGRNHVVFVGAVLKSRSKTVTGLNWHGPDPLILHVHLDLAPLARASLREAETFEATSASHRCTCAATKVREGERDWNWPQGEHEEGLEYAFEESEARDGRFDEPEEALEWAGEDVQGQSESFETFDSEANVIDLAGLSPAEQKALAITSTLETGQRGGFYGLSGNFDGQGLSFGLVNWTIGTGSLQPLLRDFANEEPGRWAATFGPDAERFRSLIMQKGSAALSRQHRFAIDEMNDQRTVNGRIRWMIKEPWRSYFRKLSEDPAFRRIQLRYVRDLLARAAYFCRAFGLKSEQAFAFMFDAVSSHGKWWLTRKFGTVEKRRLMIEERLRRLQPAYGQGRVPESEILLIIADVLAETSAPRWAAKVRARKRWFVTGQHPRARELAGLEPNPNRPWIVSAPAQAHETAETLAWLDPEEAGYETEQPETEYESGYVAADAAEESDGEWEWQPSEPFMESILEAGEGGYPDFEETEAPGPTCLEYPAGYEKIIRRRGTKEGEVLDRTTGNSSIELTLQFRDYDVNAYLAGTKSAHSAGLVRVTEFIRARLAAGSAVEVTLTGSASRTGTARFNQELSEKRAHCMAEMIKTSLTPGEVARIRFNEKGEGFTRAQCNGADCELPGYRSVLISVHAPDRPPPPIPPEPPGWDKYEIRCCAFQSTSLGQVLVDEMLNKLPGGLPRAIAERLMPILKSRIEAVLKRLLKRLPRLTALGGDLNKLLKFLPIEVTRQKAIFQIRERGKPDPQLTTLCYDGWGGRLALPVPGTLDDALDELLKGVPGLGAIGLVRDTLKKIIKDELEGLLPQRITKLMAKLDSTIPGPWKAFDLNRRAALSVFAGDAAIFVDVVTDVSGPGQITLGFDASAWTRPDPAKRITLRCPKGCATSVIQFQVDGGVGFDLLSVNKGSLVPQGCSCSREMSEEELFSFA
ncbi:hypothetical protein [Rhizobium mesoamericanum]|uniref:hypothetical protein n=1 Tax=Rhizobium mesoamericanum TaxID=1079800 RepID=UPI00041C5A17|nr:hypothetical protein [Rhizobium mesoamericanum]